MSRRVPALINAEMLVWARENLGYSISEVAVRLRTKPEQIGQWEVGILHPTLPQLRKLAHLYKRPIALFYLSEKPTTFQPLKDFRRLYGTQPSRESPALRTAIEEALSRRDVALDLSEDLGEAISTVEVGIDPDDDPEPNANAIRSYLGLTFEEQTSCRTDHIALQKWTAAVESKGVLVFQVPSIPVEEMRGFSISQNPFPVVCLNTRETPRGRIFTLLHEFTHLVIKDGGVCDLHDDAVTGDAAGRIEVLCNRLAGAIAVPREKLLREEIISRKASSRGWTDDDLKQLSNRYKISQEAVLRRMLILDLVSETFYRAKREEYLKRYQSIAKRKPKVLVPPYRRAISKGGVVFTRLVLSAYHQEKITSSALSDFLGLNLKHVPKLESALLFKEG